MVCQVWKCFFLLGGTREEGSKKSYAKFLGVAVPGDGLKSLILKVFPDGSAELAQRP